MILDKDEMYNGSNKLLESGVSPPSRVNGQIFLCDRYCTHRNVICSSNSTQGGLDLLDKNSPTCGTTYCVGWVEPHQYHLHLWLVQEVMPQQLKNYHFRRKDRVSECDYIYLTRGVCGGCVRTSHRRHIRGGQRPWDWGMEIIINAKHCGRPEEGRLAMIAHSAWTPTHRSHKKYTVYMQRRVGQSYIYIKPCQLNDSVLMYNTSRAPEGPIRSLYAEESRSVQFELCQLIN